MSYDDWAVIGRRFEELAKVIRELLPTSIATRKTCQFCKHASGRSQCLKFVAGVSWQPDSPIEAAERCWPVARVNPVEGEPKIEIWDEALLFRKATGIPEYDDDIERIVRLKNAIAPLRKSGWETRPTTQRTLDEAEEISITDISERRAVKLSV